MSGSSHAPYRTILKSTSIVGGAQIASIGFGMVRIKALALLLGPSGVGIAGMYQAATGLVGILTGFGIGAAGVRQIAEATGTGDDVRIARTVVALRRVARISGALGMAVVLLLSVPLARVTFNREGYSWGVALMSLTLLFSGIGSGQMALLQGLRRLKDLATCSVLGSAFGTASSIVLVYVLRERGIVPFLVVAAAFSSLASWWFARRVQVEQVDLPWSEMWNEVRPLLSMGSAFVISGLCGAGVAWLTRTLVARELGIDAVGLYTATLTLSSVYVGVILGAMGADFYPRLTAVANDNAAVNRLVNQQTEMGLLIAVPGLLATLVLAPWVLKAFYSSAFVDATEVLRWQALGVGLRVVSWPLGFVQLAQGRAQVFMATEVIFSALQVVLLLAGVRWLGLLGCGVSFFVVYVAYTGVMLRVCHRLSGFTWSKHSTMLVVLSVASSSVVLAVLAVNPWDAGKSVGAALTMLVAVMNAGVLKRKLGVDSTGMWRRAILKKRV